MDVSCKKFNMLLCSHSKGTRNTAHREVNRTDGTGNGRAPNGHTLNRASTITMGQVHGP